MAQAGLLIPAADGSQIPVFRTRVCRHRRRAVDLREPQHVLRRTSRNIVAMDAALDAAGAGAARRSGRRHRPARRGRARDGDHRPLPPARRDGGGDDALRRAEVVRVDDRGRDGGRVRVRPADVRADLPPELRLARQQPGARDRDAARACRPTIIEQARAHRSERESQLAEHLAKVERDMQALEHEHRLAARERETLDRDGGEAARPRTGAAQPRGDVQAAGSTSGSKSGCATRAGRSTPSSRR